MRNVLQPDEVDNFDLECRSFQTEEHNYEKGQRLDCWWWELKKSEKFPHLCKMALAVLTSFHGPQVEGSFSSMNNTIHDKTTKMDVGTYSALQSVRFNLRAAKQSAVEYFHKSDYLHDKVDAALVRNM